MRTVVVVGVESQSADFEEVWTIVLQRVANGAVRHEPRALDLPEDVRAALRAWVK